MNYLKSTQQWGVSHLSHRIRFIANSKTIHSIEHYINMYCHYYCSLLIFFSRRPQTPRQTKPFICGFTQPCPGIVRNLIAEELTRRYPGFYIYFFFFWKIYNNKINNSRLRLTLIPKVVMKKTVLFHLRLPTSVVISYSSLLLYITYIVSIMHKKPV